MASNLPGEIAIRDQLKSMLIWCDHYALNQTTSAKSNWREIYYFLTFFDVGLSATISPVLYANMVHPEFKEKYPDWTERAKQIMKIWRRIPTEERAPFLAKARENRAQRRMDKSQKQVSEVNFKWEWFSRCFTVFFVCLGFFSFFSPPIDLTSSSSSILGIAKERRKFCRKRTNRV